jgi:hypothetical protein
VCCGSPIEIHEKHALCAECLERAAAYDDTDPYAELGEGD